MFKKSLATAALAVVAIFAFAPAANAVDYVSDAKVSIVSAPVAGETAVVGFAASAFGSEESVTYTVSGSHTAVLTVIKTAVTSSLTKNAELNGSSFVNVAIPSNATGDYTVLAKSATKSYTATLTVVAGDAGAGTATGNALPSTGYNAPVLVIWGAAGLLILGAALVAVRISVRRQHAAA
ncbi:LPXTG cell wall anchor domain-containing protein [Cryobacterium sp. TMT1-3]|uniref:LPXTG cell wall anchor domain-containing protein n=1 Tax=Cryobacterium sp. TMT1-3 TaxID=1259237 RepID=UPI00106DB921|nr:LPXTG cell wall anchor domain-containing protein [Cryobacterium sp. TMT1-3]TFC24404.1 LPXTG cell wall anchor domain-containing protein [Cryobacterium sp. TMT1-3]